LSPLKRDSVKPAQWTELRLKVSQGKESGVTGNMPDGLAVAVRWEDTDLQADLTMGNLASALTLQSEEAALIAELRAGSEEAFAWLIARYHQPIYSLLARTVQDRAKPPTWRRKSS
jgi:hypothetical protein